MFSMAVKKGGAGVQELTANVTKNTNLFPTAPKLCLNPSTQTFLTNVLAYYAWLDIREIITL